MTDVNEESNESVHIDHSHTPVGYAWLNNEFVNVSNILSVVPVDNETTSVSFIGEEGVIMVDMHYSYVLQRIDSALRKLHGNPQQSGCTPRQMGAPFPARLPSHGGATISTR